MALKIPYQHLSQCPCLLMINEFHRATELNVHITVDADQTAFILGLAPFEADNDFFINPVVICSLAENQNGFGEEAD
jgi:hypothetical protein